MAFVLSWFLSFFPETVESVYSRGIYPVFAKVLSWVFGWAPFSVGEFVIVASILWILWQLGRGIRKRLRRERSLRNLLWHGALNTFTVFSVLAAAGDLLWGFHHRRLPFATLAGLEIRETEISQLEELCHELVDRCNQIREQVPEDGEGVAKLKTDSAGVCERAPLGLERLASTFPFFGTSYGAPKGVFFSIVMSYCGIGGIFDPFTGEANINTHMPEFEIPTTACHEMAHQHGFAREDEANFIAFLVCRAHPDPDFQYSGHKLALAHSMNQLYLADLEAWKRCAEKRSPAVLRDLQFSRNYWRRFESPIEKVSSAINDAYLKSQGQVYGVRSYGRMVDLLLAERKAPEKK